MANQLSKLGGTYFDKSFAAEMVKDYKKALSEFEQEANSTGNPPLRVYARVTILVLQKHLRMAQTAGQPSADSEGVGPKRPKT
jgi:putative membrane protein